MSSTDRLYLESLALLQRLAEDAVQPDAAQEPLRTLRGVWLFRNDTELNKINTL